jgi:hypothetical protein
MAPTTRCFDCIIARCRELCTGVQVLAYDERPARALILSNARYGDYDIYITEVVLSDDTRKYAYYALKDEQVIAGFDNAPDPDALKIKYGAHYTRHRLELVPHLHHAGKTQVSLTDALDFDQFIAWIDRHL